MLYVKQTCLSFFVPLFPVTDDKMKNSVELGFVCVFLKICSIISRGGSRCLSFSNVIHRKHILKKKLPIFFGMCATVSTTGMSSFHSYS